MQFMESIRERYLEDGDPPIPFERWRALAPRIAALAPEDRPENLASAGIEPARWERADSYWSLTLAAECARADYARAEDFGRACMEARSVAHEGDPSRAGDTQEAGDTPAEGEEHEDTAPPMPEPVAAPALELPSFLRSDMPAANARAAWAATAPVAPAPEQATEGTGRATVALSPFAAPKAATPFLPGLSGLALPSPNPAHPRAPGETVELSGPAVEQVAELSRATPAAPRPKGTTVLDPDVIASILQGAAAPKR